MYQILNISYKNYMCRLIHDSKEKKLLIETYFAPLGIVNNILRHLSAKDRYAYTSGEDCCVKLSKWYDDIEKLQGTYIGDGNVEFIGWTPFFKEDIKVIVSNEEFYTILKKYANDYIEKYGEEKVINEYVEAIKMKLDL